MRLAEFPLSSQEFHCIFPTCSFCFLLFAVCCLLSIAIVLLEGSYVPEPLVSCCPYLVIWLLLLLLKNSRYQLCITSKDQSKKSSYLISIHYYHYPLFWMTLFKIRIKISKYVSKLRVKAVSSFPSSRWSHGANPANPANSANNNNYHRRIQTIAPLQKADHDSVINDHKVPPTHPRHPRMERGKRG